MVYIPFVGGALKTNDRKSSAPGSTTPDVLRAICVVGNATTLAIASASEERTSRFIHGVVPVFFIPTLYTICSFPSAVTSFVERSKRKADNVGALVSETNFTLGADAGFAFATVPGFCTSMTNFNSPPGIQVMSSATIPNASLYVPTFSGAFKTNLKLPLAPGFTVVSFKSAACVASNQFFASKTLLR